MKVKPVCPYCMSDDVTADAAVQWSTDKQEWDANDPYDKSGHCNNCDSENIHFDWVEIE